MRYRNLTRADKGWRAVYKCAHEDGAIAFVPVIFWAELVLFGTPGPGRADEGTIVGLVVQEGEDRFVRASDFESCDVQSNSFMGLVEPGNDAEHYEMQAVQDHVDDQRIDQLADIKTVVNGLKEATKSTHKDCVVSETLARRFIATFGVTRVADVKPAILDAWLIFENTRGDR